jgi:Caspase domain
MRRLLTGPLCAWPQDRVTVEVERESPGDLPDQLVELFAQARDVALFYYVGHGQVDFEDQLCLGLRGSRLESERRATTSLTFEAVRRALRASPAATKVVILDCCFAGHAVHARHTLSGSADVDIPGLVGASGAYILAATGPASTAWFEADTESPLPHTHFTRALLNVVTRGIPGEQGALTLEPIYRQLRDALNAAGRPTPTRNSRDLAGDFVFARNASPRPAPPAPSAAGPGGDPAYGSRLLEQAEDAARSIHGQAAQAAALIRVARAATALSEPDHARRLLEEAERIIGAVPDPREQATGLVELASTVVTRDPGHARRLLEAIETAFTSDELKENGWNEGLAMSIEEAALFRLDPDRIERIARDITSTIIRDDFVARAAAAIAVRDPGRAERFTNAASDLEAQGKALDGAVDAIAHDAPDDAERIARGIADSRYRARALAKVAAATGPRDPQRGAELLADAESAAHESDDTDEQLLYVVYALCSSPRIEHAARSPYGVDWLREQASRITSTVVLPRYLAQAARATAWTMLPDRPEAAREYLEWAVSAYEDIGKGADEAEEHWEKDRYAYILRDAAITMIHLDTQRAVSIMARLPNDAPVYLCDQVYLELVPKLAPLDPALSESIAQSIASPGSRAVMLATVAKAIAEDDPGDAAVLLQCARRLARAAGFRPGYWQHPNLPDRVVCDIIAVVATYDHELAATILNEDIGAERQDDGLACIARALSETDLDRAAVIARTITDPAGRLQVLAHLIGLHAGSGPRP